MAISCTQRTLRALREQGLICGITEKWNPYVGPHGIRQDLFGFIDIIALDPQDGIIAIQSCGSSFSQHKKKILEETTIEVTEWLKCSGKLQLWGWRKIKLKRGSKAMRWKARIADIYLIENNIIYEERK